MATEASEFSWWGVAQPDSLSEITTPNGGAMYIGASENGQAMEVWCHSMDKEGGRVIVNIPVFLGW